MGRKLYALFFNNHLINESTEKEDLLRFRRFFVRETRKRMRITTTNNHVTNKTTFPEKSRIRFQQKGA